MSDQIDAAKLAAKLLASRHTSLDEVPHLIENVQRALSDLSASPPVAAAPASFRRRPRGKAPERAREVPDPIDVEPVAAKPALPTLVRRASVAPAAISSAPPVSILAPASPNIVRGVVQWFDSRNGEGMLRLPGFSRDVAVDAAMLNRFGISRLFKGQEVDATLEGAGDAPKITALHLANAPQPSPIMVGTVRDRHAKTVVVELKRETQRRSAARAEAELLLPPRSAR